MNLRIGVLEDMTMEWIIARQSYLGFLHCRGKTRWDAGYAFPVIGTIAVSRAENRALHTMIGQVRSSSWVGVASLCCVRPRLR
jgi:hypothetical protein